MSNLMPQISAIRKPSSICTRSPYHDESLSPVERGRWHVGWVRRREQKVYQTEVYVQDAEALLAYAPDKREFQIQQAGEKRRAFGHHAHRAMSVLDVRFLYNIAKASPVDLILDPFAGYGGIIFEGRRRGLSVIASDIDFSLSPGLSALTPSTYFVADARSLPLAANSIDLIVTEPPFRTAHRQAVMDSIPVLHRALKPDGRMILLDIHRHVRRSVCSLRATWRKNQHCGCNSARRRVEMSGSRG